MSVRRYEHDDVERIISALGVYVKQANEYKGYDCEDVPNLRWWLINNTRNSRMFGMIVSEPGKPELLGGLFYSLGKPVFSKHAVEADHMFHFYTNDQAREALEGAFADWCAERGVVNNG